MNMIKHLRRLLRPRTRSYTVENRALIVALDRLDAKRARQHNHHRGIRRILDSTKQ